MDSPRFLLPRLLLYALLPLVAACSAPVYAPAPGGEVLPAEAQRVIDRATATAAVAATESAHATATRQREMELQSDSLTSLAAQVAAETTHAAREIIIGAATHDARETAAWATPTWAAVGTQQARSALTDQAAEQTTARLYVFWNALAVMFIAAMGVVIYYLHQLGQVHIASLKVREIAEGVVGQLRPGGWEMNSTTIQQIETPPAEVVALPMALDLTNTAKREQDWSRAIRWLATWAERENSWSNSTLCDKADVVSDEGWRVITDALAGDGAGVLTRAGGRNRRETTYADGWERGRLFQELGVTLFIPCPSGGDVPSVKSPYHNTTATQRTQHHNDDTNPIPQLTPESRVKAE